MVIINEIPFSFVPGRGTTDTIFFVCQLQGMYIVSKKPLYLAFVDIEKAFKCAKEGPMVGLKESWGQVMVCAGYQGHVLQGPESCAGQWLVQWGVSHVHNGSDLSPLLFILGLEALSWVFHTSVPWELLYADNLVLIVDTQEEFICKFKVWRAGMETKMLHVNMKKTKFLVSNDDQDVLQKSGKYPCDVCFNSVCRNSILCSQCMLWIHKTRSGITKWLVEDPNYICPRCKGESWSIDSQTVTEVDVDGTMIGVEATFCYLGDMLCSSGGCDSAVAAWCCVAWGKFMKLLPVLTSRHLSPRIHGKVYVACFHSAMLHSSKTWGPKQCELQQLHRNDRAMIHWICGIKDRDKTPSASLLHKLYIQDTTFRSSLLVTQMVLLCTVDHFLCQIYHKLSDSWH